MKKTLLLMSLMVLSIRFALAQCVPTCSNYAMSAIAFTTFPSAGVNAIPLLMPTADDGTTTPISIGFNFNFYCNVYTQVLICSNGFLQFNIGSPPDVTYANPAQLFPDPTAPNGIVALNMSDFDASIAGSMITYTTIGTTPNQMFILTYSNVPIWTYPNSPNTGQIVLYETSNIIEIYTGNVSNQSIYPGTQGIENATGTQGSMVPGRNASLWSASSSAYRWAPYTPTPPGAVNGNTSICAGTTNSYSIATISGATSYSWALPGGWTGSSTTTAISAGAGASGNLSVTATYTCGTSAPALLTVSTTPAPVVGIASASPQVLCSGLTFTVVPSGGASYTLNPGNYTGTSSFVIPATAPTTYTLYGIDASNCVSYNNPTTFIQVNMSPTVTASSGSICQGQSFDTQPAGAYYYQVSGGFPVVTPQAPGVFTYTINGTSLNGCSSNTPAISTVTAVANPSISISANKTAICKNEPAVITASGATTYSWSSGQSTATITVNPVVTTVYTATGTTLGCSRSKNVTLVVYDCTGIEELAGNAAAVAIYPNPSSGLFNIQFGQLNAAATLEVFDITGRLILRQQVSTLVSHIDLAGQPAGVYYIQVNAGKGKTVLKAIKE